MPSSRPFCGYRRLSSDRDGDKLGREVQTTSGQQWAEGAGEAITQWFDDPNVTAADEAAWREGYEQMLKDLEAGLYAGVVVYRCDRLTRLSGEFERCLRAARKGNAIIVSAHDRYRSDNPDQLFMMKFNVMMAEKEVIGMKIRITANSSLRRKKGIYQGGRRPYGFEGADRDKETKKLKNPGRVGIAHVDEEVKNLREAAERIVAGASYAEIVRDWHSRTPPIYGASGAPWSPTTLEKVLTNPRMVGEQRYSIVDEETNVKRYESARADWDPVLDRVTWERLNARTKRDKQRGPATKYLLTEVLTCGICKRPMKGGRRRLKRRLEGAVLKRGYACPGALEAKAYGSCGRITIFADPVEHVVTARIFRRLMESREFGATISDEAALHQQLNWAAAEIDSCESDLEELQEAYKDKSNRISLQEYLNLRKPLHERQDQAKSLIKSLTQRMNVPHPAGKDYNDLRGWFETLTLKQQQKLVAGHVTRVLILPAGPSGRHFNPERVKVTFADAEQVDG